MNELLLRRRLLMSGQSKGEYVEYPDAYKMVYVLSAQTELTLFSKQTPTPTKVIFDGVEVTASKTFTFAAGTHTLYIWLNPWSIPNNYAGQLNSYATPYLVELRLPTWENVNVTSTYKEIFNFTPSASLTEITCLSQTPPNFGSGPNRNEAFRTSTLKKIRVPKEALSDYQTAQNWSATAVKNKLVGVKFDFGE